MSDKAKEILKLLQSGSLPNLNSDTNSTATSTSSGIDTSKRGLDRSTFGLQTLNEGGNSNIKSN